MSFLSAFDFQLSVVLAECGPGPALPGAILIPPSTITSDLQCFIWWQILSFVLRSSECKSTVYSSPLEWNWGTLHMELGLSLSKSSGPEGEVTYLTARAIQNLQNVFTAVPVANQRPPSLKSITCFPGDLPNNSSPWEAPPLSPVPLAHCLL